MTMVAQPVVSKRLPANIRDGSAKLFAKYVLSPDQPCFANPTMADFWIQNRWYKSMPDGSKKLKQANWRQGFGIREEAVRFLVEKVLRKDPRDMIHDDFELNRLAGLLVGYYHASPYTTLKEAGYTFHPWEMVVTPRGLFNSEENRIAAVCWLVDKLGKDPRDIVQEDFHSNRLGGLLVDYYKHSPYAALKEAGYDFHPWEMSCTPMGFYADKENRIAAIRWLVDKLGKDPRDIVQEDFYSNRLYGLFHYYNDSPYAALKEAGYDFHPWEMSCTPMGFYMNKENRIAAIRWLVDKLKKAPRDITEEDFNSNRLGGLLVSYYNGSPYDALLEAGLVTTADEAYMRRYGSARFTVVSK